jgi:hypothetical protein
MGDKIEIEWNRLNPHLHKAFSFRDAELVAGGFVRIYYCSCGKMMGSVIL